MRTTDRMADLATDAPAADVALFIDLENVVYDLRESGDWEAARALVVSLVHGVSSSGVIRYGVASADRTATRELAFELAEFGIRTFPHQGGKDAADRELIRRIRFDIPLRVEMVVIVSGDHAFVPAIRDLKEQALRVEVMAPKGHGAVALREAADLYTEFEADELLAEDAA